MHATCWSDYLCPWCYVGQDRSALMERLGVAVTHRPYELHPEIPPEGRRIRTDGRLAATFARIAAECEQLGMDFAPPTRMPNTRLALEASEWVRVHHRRAFDGVHTGLFRAHFAEGRAIDDPEVVAAIVERAGAPAEEALAAHHDGRASALVVQSMAEAVEQGVTSTPTWVLDDGFVVPGAFDHATLERWLTKIVTRAGTRPSPAT